MLIRESVTEYVYILRVFIYLFFAPARIGIRPTLTRTTEFSLHGLFWTFTQLYCEESLKLQVQTMRQIKNKLLSSLGEAKTSEEPKERKEEKESRGRPCKREDEVPTDSLPLHDRSQGTHRLDTPTPTERKNTIQHRGQRE